MGKKRQVVQTSGDAAAEGNPAKQIKAPSQPTTDPTCGAPGSSSNPGKSSIVPQGTHEATQETSPGTKRKADSKSGGAHGEETSSKKKGSQPTDALPQPAPVPLPTAPDPKLGMTKERFIHQCIYSKRLGLQEVSVSWLNRHGKPLSGKHCHNLGRRVNTVDKFNEARYRPALCHEPDPDRPTRVAEHYNKMARCDPCLAPVPYVALHGSLCKCHLWGMLWAFKSETVRWFGDPEEDLMLPDGSQPTLMDHVENGCHYRVIKWEGFRDFQFLAIEMMEEDNYDAAFSLPEDEFSLGLKVHERLADKPPVGKSQSEFITDEILKSPSNKWTKVDITQMFNFVRNVTADNLQFLSTFSSTFGDPDVLVPCGDFNRVATLAAPFVEMALIADQVMSDKTNSTTRILGRSVAQNWTTSDIDALRKDTVALAKLEENIAKIYVGWCLNPG